MASLRKHPRSPYWYLRKLDADTGKWVESTTGYRTDDPVETRKAQRLAEKTGTTEKSVERINSAFSAWVPEYLSSHYAEKQSTGRRMQIVWQALKLFLNDIGVTYPRQVKYRHAREYLTWRLIHNVHGKLVGRNTALLEFKFLAQLIQESIRREFCEANPIAKLGETKSAQKVKPELTDDDIAKLRMYLGNPNRMGREHAPWMLGCFEISLHTGCRFNETAIQPDDIDLQTSTLRLRDSKRKETDPRKFFSVPILPGLKPVLERIKEGSLMIGTENHRTSREQNHRINLAFKAAGVDATFHSLRVTYVTRLHRAGVKMADAMILVNHSSQLIHRIYSRLNVNDVRASQAMIQLPSS